MARTAEKNTWNVAGVGAAVALAVAVWQGLGAPTYQANTSMIAAQVNDVDITMAELELAIEAIRRDKHGAVTHEDRKRALDTLIKEELLVQRAVELGLFETDRGVRKASVDAMLQFALTRMEQSPSEDQLRAWFEDHAGLFAKAGRLRASVARVPTDEDAAQFAQIITASDFPTAVRQMPTVTLLPVPDIAIPPAKMRDYIGPEMVSRLATLQDGDIAGPFPQTDGTFLFAWLKQRTTAQRPEFDAIRDTVEAEWLRSVREKAVDDYIAMLWRQADIDLNAGPLPQ
ncbi:MAG: peptidylprolyl isomerase [Rhizobiaceae bacterium]|nr:peptidylprolyl isomerase [Rhizobiaceae bacterium]